ncbi:MAG: ester cyclase [Chloroflexota bacterium]
MNAQDVRQFMQRYFEAVAVDIDSGVAKYVGDEKLVEHARFFQSGFPGYQIEPIETVAEGNKFVAYALFRGTHRGTIMGLEPTGKEVSVPFMIIYIVEDEKIVDHHIVINELSLLQQLGAMPEAAPSHG